MKTLDITNSVSDYELQGSCAYFDHGKWISCGNIILCYTSLNEMHKHIYYTVLIQYTTEKLTLVSNKYEVFLTIYILSYVLAVPLLV